MSSSTRFGGREPAGHEEHGGGRGDEEEELAFVEFVGADALLQGIESHADFQLTSTLLAEVGLDFVRGSLKDDDLPLPRIPPLKFRGGLRYQRNALQIGGQVIAAAKQDRLSTNETADRRLHAAEALRLVLVRQRRGGPHDHRAARQRDERALPEPPVADQGPGARDGQKFQSGLQREVLDAVRRQICLWTAVLHQRRARPFPCVKVSDSFGICVTIGRMIQASANGTSRVSVSDSHWM